MEYTVWINNQFVGFAETFDEAVKIAQGYNAIRVHIKPNRTPDGNFIFIKPEMKTERKD